jgi:hypothetical protein
MPIFDCSIPNQPERETAPCLLHAEMEGQVHAIKQQAAPAIHSMSFTSVWRAVSHCPEETKNFPAGHAHGAPAIEPAESGIPKC